MTSSKSDPVREERCPVCGGTSVNNKFSQKTKRRQHPEDYWCGACKSHFDDPIELTVDSSVVVNSDALLNAIRTKHAFSILTMADRPTSAQDEIDNGVPAGSAHRMTNSLTRAGGLAEVDSDEDGGKQYLRPADALVIDFRGSSPTARWENLD